MTGKWDARSFIRSARSTPSMWSLYSGTMDGQGTMRSVPSLFLLRTFGIYLCRVFSCRKKMCYFLVFPGTCSHFTSCSSDEITLLLKGTFKEMKSRKLFTVRSCCTSGISLPVKYIKMYWVNTINTYIPKTVTY